MHMPRMYMHIIIMTAANFIPQVLPFLKFIVAIINMHFQNVNTYFPFFPILDGSFRIWYKKWWKRRVHMEKYAWKATVKEGCMDEYIRRHDEIWQEMKDVLHAAGIRNYTIWNVGDELFGYYECDSVEEAARVQAASPVVDKWNAYMKDVMKMEMDPVTGAQPLMRQVFFFD